MITIYDIAQKAKVSHTTVSLALRGSSSISEKTRTRIQLLARELGYYPNQAAAILKNNSTKRIALMLPQLDVFSRNSLIVALEQYCGNDGYEVVLMQVSNRREKMQATMKHMLQGGFCAAVCYFYDFSPVSELVNEFIRSGKPLVVIGPPQDQEAMPGVYRINVDNSQAVRDGINMLIAQGHCRIVHSILPTQLESSSSRRIINETLAAAGLEHLNTDFIYRTSSDSEDCILFGYQAARLLFRQHPGVTAIQCLNDLFAFGLMRGFKEFGVRVPDDISVIGSDNHQIGEFNSVSLTTIDMRLRDTAAYAWQILTQAFAEPDFDTVFDPVVLRANLIVRESTGSVPALPFQL